MRVSAGAVVATLIAAVALAGCGGGSPARAPAAVEFIDLVSVLPRSLDPADEQGAAADRLATSLASTLVRPAGRPPGSATLAPASAVVGFLATSWVRLPGGDYVLALRRGVRSAYGHLLTGADVSFSFRRELALSATARSLARAARINLRDPVTVLGAGRVRLNVTAASPFALALLGDFHFGVLDSRAVAAHESAADPSARGWLAVHLAGYGAYQLLGFEPAAKLLLRANPQFWRPLAFRLVAVEAVASSTLRVSEVAAAQASHTDALGWRDFEIAAHTSGLRAVTLPSTAVDQLVPDERFRPFANVLVRRALSLAIDRAALARAAFGALAAPALHPEPSTLAPVAGVVEPAYANDVALARALLARAGYPRGFGVVLAASLAETPAAAAELASITLALRAIDVTVTVRDVASAGALATLERSGSVGGVLETSVAALASPAFAITTEYLRGSPANVEGYDSPALDALAGPLSASAPAPATLQRALNIVASTFPVVPLVEVPSQAVGGAQIRGYLAHPTGAVYYDELSD